MRRALARRSVGGGCHHRAVDEVKPPDRRDAQARTWRLYRGAELLADIVVEDTDMPWVTGRVLARPGLEELRPAFEREWALINEADDLDYDAWERAYEPISRLTLASPTGPVAEFLLHIEGDEARFRWSAEPAGGP